eukprot:3442944-Pyramimonas_sp.AAC.1
MPCTGGDGSPHHDLIGKVVPRDPSHGRDAGGEAPQIFFSDTALETRIGPHLAECASPPCRDFKTAAGGADLIDEWPVQVVRCRVHPCRQTAKRPRDHTEYRAEGAKPSAAASAQVRFSDLGDEVPRTAQAVGHVVRDARIFLRHWKGVAKVSNRASFCSAVLARDHVVVESWWEILGWEVLYLELLWVF